jgi:hypothetical protein
MMRGVVLALWLVLQAAAGPAVAGPYEDADAALARRDYATAFQMLRTLASTGHTTAQARLGTMYENGWGTAQNYPER